MAWVIRLYWWMGGLGVAICAILTLWLWKDWTTDRSFQPVDYLVAECYFIVSMVVFYASMNVAARLRTNPEGMLPWARLVGIIMAMMWFPIFGWPAIFCVRAITEHFDVYCRSFKKDRGGQADESDGSDRSSEKTT